MVYCVAKVHDSVQDDLKHDEVPREVQNCISPQPQVDLEDCTGQEDISQHLPDCMENKVSRQVEDDLKDDAQEVDDDLKDEGKKDIRHPDGLKADKVTDDIPRKLEDDIKSYEDEIKDDQMQDIIPQKLDGEILSSKDDGKDICAINLINLPTELLVKIIFYLPICDRMMMRHISQRFRNVAEIPLLWKEFTLYHRPYLKRHHMGIMENLLKMIGEHVRKMYIGAVTSTALGMVSNCRNVTHLILYEKFSPLWVVKAMPHLQYLELIPEVGGYYYCSYDDKNDYYAGIENTVELLKIIPVSVKKLDLVLSSPTDLEPIVTGIQAFANDGLPSIINIFGEFNITATDDHTYIYDRTRGDYWEDIGKDEVLSYQ